MRKLYRGEVIRVHAPDKNGGLKERHVIVHKEAKKDDEVISIYCTGENNGDDLNNIFVEFQSEDGTKMGLTKDTYVRTTTIIKIPAISVVRPVGKCPFMHLIDKKQDDNMAK
jgi:hypothetical protein